MRGAAEVHCQICDANLVLSDPWELCPCRLWSIEWQATNLQNLDLIVQAI